MLISERKLKIADILWLLGFVLGAIVLFQKCKYGFGSEDESFLLSVPYRLAKGDGLFVHEYHLSQMSSVMVYPFMWLYLQFAESTEGMILVFRHIFTTLHCITAAFLYVRLRKKNVGAVFVSLLYLGYTPFGVMALSYNSMGIALMCVCAVLYYTNETGRRAEYVLAGIAFSGAVLCCPFLIIVYVYYLVICGLTKKYAANAVSCEAVRGTVFFTVGCALSAAVFLAFVFSRCSLQELFSSLPVILDDPEHPGKGLFWATAYYVYAILISNRLAPAAIVALGALMVMAFKMRNDRKAAPVILLLAIALTAIYAYPFFTKAVFINFLMFPMVILGFVVFAMNPCRYLKEFLLFVVPGLLYGWCVNGTSNQYFYVISSVALLSSMGGILMMVDAIEHIYIYIYHVGLRKGLFPVC